MSIATQREGVFRRLLPDIRSHERERVVFFAQLRGLITCGQMVGLAGSDALFLAEFGASALPGTFILASLLSLSAMAGYMFVVGRVRNDRLFVWMLVGSAMMLGLGVLGAVLGLRWVLIAFFCTCYVTWPVFLTVHFPTFTADYFDTVSSKRVNAAFVGGGSLGGIIGGLLALGLSQVIRTEALIAAWAVLLLLSAGLVHLRRNDLRRWIPVGSEADDSSAEGMLSALRYVGRSHLARWLVISVVGMVLALFLMQYIEMTIMAAAFDTPQALAAFLAAYLAITNGIEIAVVLILFPALVRRGVATANLLHPLLTLLTYGLLLGAPVLSVAVMARVNRELMDNALAENVRALAYNALPFRFRARIRALLEGVIYYAPISLAGVVLLLMGDGLDAFWLALCGVGATLVYGGANLMVRREYLRSIVDELRSGRLDLDAGGTDLDDFEMVVRLGEEWERSISQTLSPEASQPQVASESEGELGDEDAVVRPPRDWLELPALLARHRIVEPLYRGAAHPHPQVRVACIEALSQLHDGAPPDLLCRALSDQEARVRLATARAAGRLEPLPDELAAELRQRLDDSDLQVRAEAASHSREPGRDVLREMAGDPEPESAIAALTRLPAELLPCARERLTDPDAGVRAAALECVARLDDAVSISIESLRPNIEHADARVRRAATRALGTRTDAEFARVVALSLDDLNRTVRKEAADALSRMGETGILASIPAIESPRRWTADAALGAVAKAGTGSARSVLIGAFGARVREAWQSQVARELLARETETSLASRFLQAALDNSLTRSKHIAFRALELLEDPVVVRSVRKALEYESARDRADALEVLSNLGERESASQLSLLLEDGPFEDKMSALPATMDLPTGIAEVVLRATDSPDRWLSMAAAGLYPDDETSTPPEASTMEKMLALRRVPLFTHLSLDQLEAIGHFMQEATYLAGEVVVREGEPGAELYVMLEGSAQALKNYGTEDAIELTTMTPSGVCYFGEIAIFDNAPRSATVVIVEDARLLTLAGDRFMELILQSPEISFEIFKVLTQRLRTAEERLRAQEDGERAED